NQIQFISISLNRLQNPVFVQLDGYCTPEGGAQHPSG
ncbi:MAG: hypothetical protein ACI9J3_003183, partial [Parvicellaceae bacterium]